MVLLGFRIAYKLWLKTATFLLSRKARTSKVSLLDVSWDASCCKFVKLCCFVNITEYVMKPISQCAKHKLVCIFVGSDYVLSDDKVDIGCV